jgi:hypothetical protein
VALGIVKVQWLGGDRRKDLGSEFLGKQGGPLGLTTAAKVPASGMRKHSDVRSCTKGNEGEQNLPEAEKVIF